MKKFLFLALLAVVLGISQSCTEYNLVDTGEARGVHNTTMWDYFATDPYNWDSLRVMARHADLVGMFDGTSAKNITFFGITNHSIRRYLLQNGLTQVADIPQSDCRSMILDCILERRVMLDEFAAGRPSTSADTPIGAGGETLTMKSGKALWVYTFRSSYNGVAETGPKQIFLVSPITTKTTRVASSNISTLTGVVHSLEYNFTLTDF